MDKNPGLNGHIRVRWATGQHDAELGADDVEGVYLSRGPQGKLRNGLRQRLTGDFPHRARHSYGHGSVGPLDDFNTDFAIGFNVQDARHEYLTKGICLESLEIGFEF